ncbi:MAG: hypothetical protein ACYS0H_29320, partial [Planctomycetota bacterium]
MPRASFEIMRHVMKAQVRTFSLIASLILCVTAFAGADLAKRIDEIISKPLEKKVKLSIHIIRANSG